MFVTPRERELLQGMGNCYEARHADFEDTVGMVGSARGLSPDEVKRMLAEISKKYIDTDDYKTLRVRLPKEFPL